MTTTEQFARQTADRLLAFVKKAEPGAQAQVDLDAQHVANTRFACNEITTGGDRDEMTVSLTVALGLKAATAQTNQVDEASLKALVERAVSMARVSPEDPETMPVLPAQKYGRSPGAFDPALESLDAAGRAGMAKTAVAAGSAAQLQVAGFIHHGSGLLAHATSAGLWAIHPHSWLSLSVTGRTGDGTGSGYASVSSRSLKEVDVRAAAAAACDTAARSRNPKKLEPGRYTVLLEPLAVEDMVDEFVGAMNARPADEGRSFFSKPGGGTREQERVVSELVTLRSDWASPLAPTLPFDAEGMPRVATTVVDRGVVKALRCDRYWAKKQKRVATPEWGGCVFQPGATPRDELIRGVKRGVLISRFWYVNRLNPQTLLMTGLTRDGTFLIENGEIVGPVNNFRFNQSAADMLAKLDGVDSRLSLVQSTDSRMPAIRTNEFWLASTSDAV